MIHWKLAWLTHELVEPLWLIPPVNAHQVDGYADDGDENSHSHLDGLNIEGHKHQEGTNDQEDDGDPDGHLDGALWKRFEEIFVPESVLFQITVLSR